MTDAQLRARIENGCRVILPERPVYVLFTEKLPEQYRPRVAGATGRSFDLIYRKEIGRRWQGRGPVVLLSLNQAKHYAQGAHPFGNVKINTRRELWRVAAHELAHISDREVIPAETAAEETDFCEVVRHAMFDFCANPLPPAIAAPCPWAEHDARFMRLLFHAAHRVRLAAGEWIPCDGWVNPRQYGLPSREDRYQSALGDEPERLADVPLTEISAIAPPERFAELWQADLRKWFTGIENPSDEQTAALLSGLRMFPTDNQTPATLASCEASNYPANIKD